MTPLTDADEIAQLRFELDEALRALAGNRWQDVPWARRSPFEHERDLAILPSDGTFTRVPPQQATFVQGGPCIRVYLGRTLVAEFNGQALIHLSRASLAAFVEGQRDARET